MLGKVSKAETLTIDSINEPSIVDTYNIINNGFSQCSKKWKKGVIGHKKKVEVIANTAEFHYDEIISYDTNFSSATELTYETVGTFTETFSVTTSESSTKAAESAIKVGAEVPGASLSSSLKTSNSYTVSVSKEYSTSYSSAVSFSEKYDMSSYDGDCSYCIGTVGDFISFKVEEYEIKNWWGDWDRCSSIKKMDAKILYHTYQTIIYSDGTFESKKGRTYLD